MKPAIGLKEIQLFVKAELLFRLWWDAWQIRMKKFTDK
jgi:hypothetical protein